MHGKKRNLLKLYMTQFVQKRNNLLENIMFSTFLRSFKLIMKAICWNMFMKISKSGNQNCTRVKVSLQRNWFKKGSLFWLRKLLFIKIIVIYLKPRTTNQICVDQDSKTSSSSGEAPSSKKCEKVKKIKLLL